MTGSDMVSKELAILLYMMCGIGLLLVCAYDVIWDWMKERAVAFLKGIFSSRPKEAKPVLRTRRVGRS